MNLLLSRLDKQQRRWYVAVEANRISYGEGRAVQAGSIVYVEECGTSLPFNRGRIDSAGLLCASRVFE